MGRAGVTFIFCIILCASVSVPGSLASTHIAPLRFEFIQPAAQQNTPLSASQVFIVELSESSMSEKAAKCQSCSANKRIAQDHKKAIISQQRSFIAQAKGLGVKLKVLRSHQLIGNYMVIDGAKTDIKTLRGLKGVKSIRPRMPVTALLEQSTRVIGTDFARQFSNNTVEGLTGKGVTVAVIDSGVDYNHQDLGEGIGPGFKVLGGYDFVDNDPDPMDRNGHGTHVAGIIAANGEIKGVAPEASLYAYRSLNEFGSGFDTDIIAAIERALDPDDDPNTDDAVDIVNLSLGGIGSVDSPLSQAVERAAGMGVLMVVAAGNDGNYYTVRSPANAESALTVGAIDNDLTIAPFSSKGPVLGQRLVKPEVTAPGVNITSTVLANNYTEFDGTSMAAPHVAGAAALLKQANPQWSADTLRTRLISTAKPILGDTYAYGAGVIDLQAALTQHTIVSPTLFNFGESATLQDEEGEGIQLSITNTASVARSFLIDVEQSDPAISIALQQAGSVDVQANSRAVVDLTLSVNKDELLVLDDWPATYESRIVLTSDNGFRKEIPINVHRSRLLTLEFEQMPEILEYKSQAGNFSGVYADGIPSQVPVRAGTYDVLALHDDAIVLQEDIPLTGNHDVVVNITRDLADQPIGTTGWRDRDENQHDVSEVDWQFQLHKYRFNSPYNGFSISATADTPLKTNSVLPFDILNYGVLGQEGDGGVEAYAFNNLFEADSEDFGATLALNTLSHGVFNLSDDIAVADIYLNFGVNRELDETNIEFEPSQPIHFYAANSLAEEFQAEWRFALQDGSHVSTQGFHFSENTDEGINKVVPTTSDKFLRLFEVLGSANEWAITQAPRFWSGHIFGFNRAGQQYVRIGQAGNDLLPGLFQSPYLLSDTNLNTWDVPIAYEILCDDDFISSGMLTERYDPGTRTYRVNSVKGCNRTHINLSFESEWAGESFTQTVSASVGTIDFDSAVSIAALGTFDSDGRTSMISDDSGYIEVNVQPHIFNGVGSFLLEWRTDGEWQTLETTNQGDLYRATLPAPNQPMQFADVRISVTSLLDSSTVQTVNGLFLYGLVAAESLDSDEDGVIDKEDAFPDDPFESIDTDNDGIGNNADEDDDGDGLPDSWEVQRQLNPLDPADAVLDRNNDGVSNLTEYRQGLAATSDNNQINNGSGGSVHWAMLLALLINVFGRKKRSVTCENI